MIRKCEQCGKEFVTYPSWAKGLKGRFCSHRCHDASRHSNRIHIKCLNCGRLVPRDNPNQKYCCHKCYGESMGKHLRRVLKCRQCGRSFAVQQGRIDTKQHTKYCSMACYSEFRRSHKENTNISVACDTCGQIVLLTKKAMRMFDHHFCSSRCRVAWLNTRRTPDAVVRNIISLIERQAQCRTQKQKLKLLKRLARRAWYLSHLPSLRTYEVRQRLAEACARARTSVKSRSRPSRTCASGTSQRTAPTGSSMASAACAS